MLDLYKEIVLHLAQAAPSGWIEIAVNYEMMIEDEGLSEDYIALALLDEEPAKAVQLPISDDLKALFRKLNDESAKANDGRWRVCDFVLSNEGQYRFDYEYGDPKRLNGIFDTDSFERFNKYERQLV